jgi:hypothetical protein
MLCQSRGRGRRWERDKGERDKGEKRGGEIRGERKRKDKIKGEKRYSHSYPQQEIVVYIHLVHFQKVQ